jgi:hypothetical protein
MLVLQTVRMLHRATRLRSMTRPSFSMRVHRLMMRHGL